MSNFTFVELLQRLERNNMVTPIETMYCSRAGDTHTYWPRDWRDLRTNGYQLTPAYFHNPSQVVYTLDSMYFTINGEIRIWLGVRAPALAAQWEIIDAIGGKPNTSQPDGGIMYDFHSCSMLNVYEKILQYAGEWVRP